MKALFTILLGLGLSVGAQAMEGIETASIINEVNTLDHNSGEIKAQAKAVIKSSRSGYVAMEDLQGLKNGRDVASYEVEATEFEGTRR